MSNIANLEEELLLCEVLGVFYSLENKNQLAKLIGASKPLIAFPQLADILKELPKGDNLAQHRSLLDQAVFGILSLPNTPAFKFLFALIGRVRANIGKSWNAKPTRMAILQELNELGQNYLVSVFVTPEMFPDAIFDMDLDLFPNFKEVMARKRNTRSSITIRRLQLVNSTVDINQRGASFLNLISLISSPTLVFDLFNECLRDVHNFAEIILAILMVELQFSSLHDTRAERLIGILTQVLTIVPVKTQFLIEMALCSAAENGRVMEFGCVLGALCSLSLVHREDFSDLKEIRGRVEDRMMKVKSQGAYNNLIKVYRSFLV